MYARSNHSAKQSFSSQAKNRGITLARAISDHSACSTTLRRSFNGRLEHFASILSMEKWRERNFIIIMTHFEQLLLVDFFHSLHPQRILLVNSRICSRVRKRLTKAGALSRLISAMPMWRDCLKKSIMNGFIELKISLWMPEKECMKHFLNRSYVVLCFILFMRHTMRLLLFWQPMMHLLLMLIKGQLHTNSHFAVAWLFRVLSLYFWDDYDGRRRLRCTTVEVVVVYVADDYEREKESCWFFKSRSEGVGITLLHVP